MASRLRLHAAEEIRVLGNAGAALAVCAPAGTYDMYQGDDVLAAVVGQPRSSGRLPAGLNGVAGWASYLASEYRIRGPKLLESLAGAFSFAIMSCHGRDAMLAIDRMGILPLAYARTGGGLVFGSNCDAVAAHPEVRAEIDPQAIFNYVYFHAVPIPQSIFRDVERLLPGSYLQLRDGDVRTAPYWEMVFDERDRRPLPELTSEFLELLRASMRTYSCRNDVGAFLSGGTDSSTVTGMLGATGGAPARTYSIGFDASGYDEMDYARISARHFNTTHHEYYVTAEDVVSAIPLVAGAYDMPFGNASAVPAYCCARLAADDGVKLMLAGDGGDELFGGNERYAKQYVFSLYERVPAVLRQALLEPLLLGMPGGDSVPPLRKARSYIRQARVPLPARLQTYNLIERLGTAEVFDREFLDRIDAGEPLAMLKRAWQGARARSMINRMLALDLRFTLADSDLPKVNQTCHLAGVEVAYPLMSDELVAFSARLEPRLKLKGTRLRYFFKEALRGFLPHATLGKQKHGFGLPFGPWMQTHRPLRELACDSLEKLSSRGFLRRGFIDGLVDAHRSEHAGYYGTMIWVLMMLEMWYQKRDAVRA